MIDITKLASSLGTEVCSALPGLHAWTGCDSVSALATQRKIKALRLVQENEKYREAFATLGGSWDMPPDLFNVIQEFTCLLYCRNTQLTSVNELRYNMFCAKKGNIESGQLPPCEDTLQQHSLQENYQTAIKKCSPQTFPDIPEPSGHEWVVDENGNLNIQWMTGPHAPDIVLTLICCKCSRSCRKSDCSCILNGLRCTAACKLQTCSNMEDDDTDIELDFADTDSGDE